MQEEMRRRTWEAPLVPSCGKAAVWYAGTETRKGKPRDRLIPNLRGHYNYYGVRGNSRALYRFFDWTKQCAFKWLNRRGGKRRSFTWARFTQVALAQIARPCITELRHPRVMA
jgi:RNA-directed DNA polymerase